MDNLEKYKEASVSEVVELLQNVKANFSSWKKILSFGKGIDIGLHLDNSIRFRFDKKIGIIAEIFIDNLTFGDKDIFEDTLGVKAQSELKRYERLIFHLTR